MKKWIVLVALALVGPFEFYVQAVFRGRVSYYSYNGMDKETIERLLIEAGALNVRFITKDAHDKAVKAK